VQHLSGKDGKSSRTVSRKDLQVVEKARWS
jgi:hypothetical protein